MFELLSDEAAQWAQSKFSFHLNGGEIIVRKAGESKIVRRSDDPKDIDRWVRDRYVMHRKAQLEEGG